MWLHGGKAANKAKEESHIFKMKTLYSSRVGLLVRVLLQLFGLPFKSWHLCARPCSGYWGHSSEQLSSHGACMLLEEAADNKRIQSMPGGDACYGGKGLWGKRRQEL